VIERAEVNPRATFTRQLTGGRPIGEAQRAFDKVSGAEAKNEKNRKDQGEESGATGQKLQFLYDAEPF
jgi:hypothetical protein